MIKSSFSTCEDPESFLYPGNKKPGPEYKIACGGRSYSKLWTTELDEMEMKNLPAAVSNGWSYHDWCMNNHSGH